VPALGGGGAPGVEGAGDAGAELGELGADVADDVPDGGGAGRNLCRRFGLRNVVLVDQEQHVPGLYGVGHRHSHGAHGPCRCRLDDMLHLH
jgi:hypothetical protein